MMLPIFAWMEECRCMYLRYTGVTVLDLYRVSSGAKMLPFSPYAAFAVHRTMIIILFSAVLWLLHKCRKLFSVSGNACLDERHVAMSIPRLVHTKPWLLVGVDVYRYSV